MRWLRHIFLLRGGSFSFVTHDHECVTRNKSLGIYSTLLHSYYFFVFDRYKFHLHFDYQTRLQTLILLEILQLKQLDNILCWNI
jgi:hypothetical protein